jgi:hypothetical protein
MSKHDLCVNNCKNDVDMKMHSNRMCSNQKLNPATWVIKNNLTHLCVNNHGLSTSDYQQFFIAKIMVIDKCAINLYCQLDFNLFTADFSSIFHLISRILGWIFFGCRRFYWCFTNWHFGWEDRTQVHNNLHWTSLHSFLGVARSRTKCWHALWRSIFGWNCNRWQLCRCSHVHLWNCWNIVSIWILWEMFNN